MAPNEEEALPADALPAEMSPNVYVEKVSLLTGEILEEEIRPEQLLVHSYRDYHLVEVQTSALLNRLVGATGDEELARQRLKKARQMGTKAAGVLARATGQRDASKLSKALFGIDERDFYFRYKKHPLTREVIAARIRRLQGDATSRLQEATVDGKLALRVLLTGGTGFVGKEVLWQAAQDEDVAEVYVLIRPKRVRDPEGKSRTLSPAERGELLLRQLWLDDPARRGKFHFIAGDVEEEGLGIAEEDFARLRACLTHVVHCAASVAFDDPFDKSFQANVRGTLHALEFSRRLQSEPWSPFVAHLSIETSYIHGRKVRTRAREDEIVFPRNFYNNYYELTKAMASIEAERFMLRHGLRVVQLCPAIVIGESRAGNNRGDTKVVNAPVNVFGRAGQELGKPGKGSWVERSSSAILARMACRFPGDPSAEINLIPVDRVVAGILAALKKPSAIGERIHLATDNRLTSEQMRRIVAEELGVQVKLADPTLHRNVTLPVLAKLLTRFKQRRLATALEKLSTIFGGYSEWGQPIHEVGNDVRLLGLPEPRPNTEQCFRMLCRHNRYVQNFGQVRDLDEVSRRERVWWDFIHDLEARSGRPAGALGAAEFHRAVESELDLERFERTERRAAGGRQES